MIIFQESNLKDQISRINSPRSNLKIKYQESRTDNRKQIVGSYSLIPRLHGRRETEQNGENSSHMAWVRRGCSPPKPSHLSRKMTNLVLHSVQAPFQRGREGVCLGHSRGGGWRGRHWSPLQSWAHSGCPHNIDSGCEHWSWMSGKIVAAIILPHSLYLPSLFLFPLF